MLARLESDLQGRTRCLECGVFAGRVMRPSAGGAGMSPVPPLQDLGEPGDEGWAGRPLRLRRGGREYRVRDLDRLRRLVVERKAAPSDLASADGVRWVPIDSIPALQPFLAVVRLLDSAPTTGGGGVLVEASAAEDGWGEGELSHELEESSAEEDTDEICETPPSTRSREPS